MLVFGALAVPRSGVLQLMTLKTHLVRVGDEFKIAWTAKEMKAGQPYEARLGPALSVLLDAYLMTYRPVLLARHKEPASDRTELWVTRFGTQMSQRSIYDVITTRTSVAFGESVFPHALRHGAATTLATERPDLIDIVTPLLQHRHASSRQYYNLATGIEASTSFGDALDQRRTATPAGRKLIGRLSRPAHARPTRRQNAPSDTGSAKTGPR
jgi:integrase/recombinase XerD